MTPIINNSWTLCEPTATQQQYDLQLLTICGVSVLGRWSGKLGEFYIGWAPLLGASMSQMIPYTTNTLDLERYIRPEKPTYAN